MPFLEGPLIWISLQLKIHHRVSKLYLPGWLMRILALSIPAPGRALSSVFVLGEPQLTSRSHGCWSKPGFFFISSTHFRQIVEDFPGSCSQKSLCQVISNQGHLITRRAVYVWSGHLDTVLLIHSGKAQPYNNAFQQGKVSPSADMLSLHPEHSPW